MKNKLHKTSEPKSSKIKMTIKHDQLNVPNKMHFDAQLRFKSTVVEDKRRKKPKHKKKIFDES